MTEGTGSKHAIVCDIVKKYVTLKGLGRTSALQTTIDFIITKPIFKSMDKMKLSTPEIIGWIGGLVVAGIIIVVIIVRYCKHEVC